MNFLTGKKNFPVGLQGPLLLSPAGTPSKVWTNVMVELLPFIEQADLQRNFDKTKGTGNAAGPNTGTAGDTNSIAAQIISSFKCPDTRLQPQNTVSGFVFGTNDFAGNGGTRIYHPKNMPTSPKPGDKAYSAAKQINDGLFNLVEPNDTGVAVRKITDGLSKTLMFGERNHEDPEFDRLYSAYKLPEWCGWAWTSDINSVGDNLGHAAVPINYMIPVGATGTDVVNDRLSAWGSYHPGGANFCLADCSVSFYADSMELTVLKALSTIRGEETVSPP